MEKAVDYAEYTPVYKELADRYKANKPDYITVQKDLDSIVQQAIIYPKQAQKDGIYGDVVVSYTITKKGTLTNAKVIIKSHPLLDAEALRVVNSMVDWIPARNGNTAINFNDAVLIKFDIHSMNAIKENQDFTKEIQEMNSLVYTLIFENQASPVVQEEPLFGNKSSVLESDQYLVNTIKKEIKYPIEAINAQLTGTVYIQIVIESNGSMSNFKIKKSPSKLFSDEVQRAFNIVAKRDKFIPAKSNGKPIRIYKVVPIRFVLQ